MEEYNNIEMVGESGLKCDNESCDWKDETVTRDMMTEWINRPCPKCGENVLTEEDFRNAEALYAMVDLMNNFSPDELETLNSILAASEASKEFEDLHGLKDLKPDDMVNMTIDTHKGINVTSVNKIEPE